MTSIRNICLLSILYVTVTGCGMDHGRFGLHQNSGVPQAALAQNPMYVPLSDREFLWNQLVDTMDNYFRIEREERVRLVGGVLTEGQIERAILPAEYDLARPSLLVLENTHNHAGGVPSPIQRIRRQPTGRNRRSSDAEPSCAAATT